jgi:glutamyl-Q tRNA(Asp) synthetase
MASSRNPLRHSADTTRYVGRFAPSPTGPLHFGSLVAAVASFLDARSHAGKWYVRIEDLDPPREIPGAADSILRTLEHYALTWDGPVIRQSERSDAYAAAIDQLCRSGFLYECVCSRTDIEAALDRGPPGQRVPTDELRYPGTCRSRPSASARPHAVRFRVGDETVFFEDGIQGQISTSVAEDCGDFVVKRKDGLYAYQLAVTVDDLAQGITHVVRGVDLLTSTPRQILLQRALLHPTPPQPILGFSDTIAYAHMPLAVDTFGRKLSKSSAAPPFDADHRGDPTRTLWQVIAFLGQDPPVELQHAALADLLAWAIARWDVGPLRLKRAQAVEVDRD